MNKQPFDHPHSTEAEIGLLGLALKDDSSALQLLDMIPGPELFYIPKHRIIWEAIAALVATAETVDVITVANRLDAQGVLERIGGRVYLMELWEQADSTAKSVIESHIGILTDCYQSRSLAELGGFIRDSAVSRNDPSEIISYASNKLLTIAAGADRSGFRPLSAILPEMMEHLSSMSKGISKFGVPTGFPSVDELTGGHSNGDLIIYMGRPSMGKTALMGCETAYQARKGYKVGVVSSETQARQYGLRLLCGDADLDSVRIRRGQISPAQWTTITDSTNKMTPWGYWIDDTPSIDVQVLATRVTALKQRQGLDILYIDYLQILTTTRHRGSKREAMNFITQRLKNLAKDLNIPIIVLAQITRAADERPNKRPLLSDGKETGAIEEIADDVIGIYRPEVYARGDQKIKYRGQAEYIGLKARNGPTGSVSLHFDAATTQFHDLADSSQERFI